MSAVSPQAKATATAGFDGNDDLLNLLTESWDDQQRDAVHTSPWTRDYLTRLTSLPLDQLVREPVDLRTEQVKMQRDAQQLAFRDYPAFIHAQSCRHQVDETLDGLGGHLDNFVSAIPSLQEACESFATQAKAITEERNKITRVLEHQNVLVDLLEIPQLMETCVWNGYYSEAMDLASHVRLLLMRYPLPVIRSIQQQVQASSDLMLTQLISHLRRPIKLAATMSVVGYLRRMDAFASEDELRILFLRCRHDFLEQRIERTASEYKEGADYLKRYVDVMREQMFEITTQYMSVFSNENQEPMMLLSDYMVHLITSMQSTLSHHLRQIEDTSALASLLTQLQYCGMSLSRVGLDFRHLFVHVFEEAVRPLILKWIDEATSNLVRMLTDEANTWISSAKLSIQTQQDDTKRNAYQPPMLLVDYLPLAVFTNNILSSFNALRVLPAVSLFAPVQNHLDACFLEIGNALKQCVDYHSDSEAESAFLLSFASAYVRCCVPFLRGCLRDGLYGGVIGDDRTDIDQDLEKLLQNHLPAISKVEIAEKDKVEDEKENEDKKENNEEDVESEKKVCEEKDLKEAEEKDQKQDSADKEQKNTHVGTKKKRQNRKQQKMQQQDKQKGDNVDIDAPAVEKDIQNNNEHRKNEQQNP
ncbi:hypothetical protein DFQ28_003376 [Apophysomyces sp. BC1034]|nr:hypothetical protein DFQ30_009669 [Apophysomyces sp. BC1015]KAG0180694.1 hypothetical protein DFQ29_000151 [Apophysomyces sp. BC1021]KAG0189448.1 hypothetical protein DFQ28_003376 [Apophysomyces sp. BC1034]